MRATVLQDYNAGAVDLFSKVPPKSHKRLNTASTYAVVLTMTCKHLRLTEYMAFHCSLQKFFN